MGHGGLPQAVEAPPKSQASTSSQMGQHMKYPKHACVWHKPAEQFVQAVKSLDYVQMVVADASARDYTRIWTVISAEPFEMTYREPIYEAELEVVKQTDEPVVDFRLINIRETDQKVEDILPTEREVLFTRPS